MRLRYHRMMSVLLFGPYRVDVAAREIHRAGRALTVPVKVFDCIAYLATNRHRAVGRDELIAAIWGRADVPDNLLAQIVLRARRLLEDSSEESRFIRTVPGFGYHWVHEANAASTSEPAAAAVPNDAAAPPRRRVRRRLGALAICLLLAAATGSALYRHLTTGTASDPAPHAPAGPPADAAEHTAGRVAPVLVLPADVRGEPDYGWARLGIMDLIAQRLRAAGQPTVSSETVVALVPPDAAPADADALAAAGGGGPIFETAVERHGGQWHVGVRALRPRGSQIEVTGEAADLLAAADAAAGQLITALGLAGPTSIARTPADRLIQEVEAALLADQLDRARGLIERAPAALRDDPRVRYQHARIDLSQARLDAAQSTLEGLLAEPDGDDALLRAQVHTSLAAVALRRHDYETSARHADEAIALTADNPLPAATGVRGGALVGRATARYAQGAYAASADDFAAARVALESTGNIRRLAVADLNEGVLQMKRGRFADAASLLERSAAYSRRVRAPTDELIARVNLLYTRLALLQDAEAAAQAAAIADLMPRAADPEVRLYGALVRVEAAEAAGRLREADALLGTLSAARESMSEVLRGQAEAAAARHALALGQPDTARRLAESALAQAWADEEPRDFARTWLTLARAVRGSAAADADVAAAARAWAAGVQAPTVTVHIALIDAEDAAGHGRIEQARTRYEDALRAADAQGVPIDLRTVIVSYVHWLIERSDLERAVAVLGRAQTWADGDYALTLARLRLYQALGQTALWRQALERTTALAGERVVPIEWTRPPDALENLGTNTGEAAGP